MLNKYGANYTDEEIEKIRDFLYLLVHIELENLRAIKEKKKAEGKE